MLIFAFLSVAVSDELGSGSEDSWETWGVLRSVFCGREGVGGQQWEWGWKGSQMGKFFYKEVGARK